MRMIKKKYNIFTEIANGEIDYYQTDKNPDKMLEAGIKGLAAVENRKIIQIWYEEIIEEL
jgi:hypothetical protein